jgi:hypothetical protein
MKCPECGVEVNVESFRCHSCGALLYKSEEKPQPKLDEIGKAGRRTLPFLFLIGYLPLLLIITFPLYKVFDNRQKSERLRDNLQIIMDNLKEYADEHNAFPAEIQLIIDEGFMIGYPQNPYLQRNMQPRPAGKGFAGDFTYLPLYDERGRIWACVLIGYGPDMNKGQDIFTEGNDYSHLQKFAPDPDGKPDGVIHILQAEKGEYEV